MPLGWAGEGTVVPGIAFALDLEADVGLGLADNDPVALWEDQSGNGNDATQGTAGNKPTFKATDGPGSRPCIRWDGNDFLTLAVALARPNYTIFAVLRPDAGGGGRTIACGPAASFQYRIQGAQKQEALSASTASIGLSDTALSNVGFQQVNVRWDGTTATFRLNSAADGNPSNAQTLSQDITRVGANASAGEGFIGDICAIKVVTSVLLLADVQTVEAALATRWGVT